MLGPDASARCTCHERLGLVLTERPCEPEADHDAAAQGSGHAGMGVLALGTDVLVGVLGLMLWQRHRDQPAARDEPALEQPRVV